MMNRNDSSCWAIMTHHDESSWWCTIMRHYDDSSWWLIMMNHDDSSWWVTMNPEKIPFRALALAWLWMLWLEPHISACLTEPTACLQSETLKMRIAATQASPPTPAQCTSPKQGAKLWRRKAWWQGIGELNRTLRMDRNPIGSEASRYQLKNESTATS